MAEETELRDLEGVPLQELSGREIRLALGFEEEPRDLDDDHHRFSLSPIEPEVCDRLGCGNKVAVECSHCGAQYCRKHPSTISPLCEGCHMSLEDDE